MKFAKILQSELVPEWKKAYIDYTGLKRLITSIKRSLKEQQSSQQSHQQEQERCESLNENNTNFSISTNSTEISIQIPQQTEKRLSNLSSFRSNSFLSRFKNLPKRGKSSVNSSRSKFRKIPKKKERFFVTQFVKHLFFFCRTKSFNII
jgi:SPX domain protein involved in polyphosphate accumulation